jgi:hypothetical protein
MPQPEQAQEARADPSQLASDIGQGPGTSGQVPQGAARNKKQAARTTGRGTKSQNPDAVSQDRRRFLKKADEVVAADGRVCLFLAMGIPGITWDILCAGRIFANNGTEEMVEKLVNQQLRKAKESSLTSRVVRKAKTWAAKLPVYGDLEVSGTIQLRLNRTRRKSLL